MTFSRARILWNRTKQDNVFVQKIVEKIVSLEEGLEQHPDRIKFLVRFEGTDCLNELVAYNRVLEALESDLLDPDEQMWSFKDIIAYEGPLTRDSPSYNGSSYNVLIAWEDGSRTFEPLKTIAAVLNCLTLTGGSSSNG